MSKDIIEIGTGFNSIHGDEKIYRYSDNHSIRVSP
jgi:hypothetical protein